MFFEKKSKTNFPKTLKRIIIFWYNCILGYHLSLPLSTQVYIKLLILKINIISPMGL